MDPENDPSTVGISSLNDACLTKILGFLPADSLQAALVTNKRLAAAVSEESSWFSAFQTAYPYHFYELTQRSNSKILSSPWRTAFIDRQHKDTNWSNGRISQAAVHLSGIHSGTVLAPCFLHEPYSTNLALTAGLSQSDESVSQGEVMLWDLDAPTDVGGRKSYRVTEHHTSRSRHELSSSQKQSTLAGIFDMQQLPGLNQFIVGQFGEGDVNIVEIQKSSWFNSVDNDDNVANNADEEEEDAYEYATLCRLVGHDETVVCTRVQGNTAVTSSFDTTIKLWQLPKCDYASSLSQSDRGQKFPKIIEPAVTLRDPQLTNSPPGVPNGAVNALAYGAADQRHLASGGNDTQVKLWDIETRKIILRLPGHEGAWVWALEPSGDGTYNVLYSGGTDGRIKVWDTRAGQQAHVIHLKQHGSSATGGNGDGDIYPVAGLKLRPDGRYIVAGSFDTHVWVTDLRTLSSQQLVGPHKDRVSRVDIRGDSILSCSFDSTAALFQF